VLRTSKVRAVLPETQIPEACEFPTLLQPFQDVPPLMSTIAVPDPVSAFCRESRGTLDWDVVGASATAVTLTEKVAVSVRDWVGIGWLAASNSAIVTVSFRPSASASEWSGGKRASDPRPEAATT
jgi:hypothetical protein